MSREHEVLGVDIGGSSIKCCLLDAQGIIRHSTLQYASGKDPDAVLGIVAEIIESWDHVGPIGIGFPGLVSGNHIVDAPNMDDGWEGFDFSNRLNQRVGGSVTIINDADAAALAMARETNGWETENILCLTLGTGIGSAWLKRGELEAGTEYGRMVHPQLGCSLEQWASVRTLNEEALSIVEWTERLVTVLEYLLKQFSPDRFVLSGGITTSSDEWINIIQQRMSIPVEIS
ncbi:MAG: ROK family protein, partial [Candidatus Thermoplasmatota archaeon]|nr:ROK family protein [Candidatus Thermoplasmatota archaeon]